ncbi:MAG: hypothetical protein KatS3mg108_3884 [Isosphaeraceae bacterium]|nr:MAG: hypothetical protein KatS3mg108_3884 [Isosphaeraceae bacterium]
MPSAGAIRAGQAYVELSTKDSKLIKGLRAAEQRLKAFGASVAGLGARLAGLGAAVVGSLFAASKVFGDLGDQLAKASTRTGVAVEELSELAFAADMSGADLETLETGLRKMAQTIVDAAGGSQTARQALDQLGLTVADLARLSPDQQFKLIADRLSQIRNPTLRAAMAMEIFGRSGTRLLPLMADGAAGIERLERQARELGLTWSTEDARAAEAFSDTLSVLWKVIQHGIAIIGGALVPILTDVAQWITRAAKTISDWINQNRELIITIFQVAAAVMAGGLALLILGKVIAAVGAILGVVATIITGVGTAISILGTVIGALLTPIGLVSVALVALGGYLLYTSGVGEQALTWLGDQFNSLKDTALAAWQGIADALAAGDIGLAARIAWLTLKLIWKQGVAWLEERWMQFKAFFIETFWRAVYGVARFLNDAWSGIQVAWVETTTFLANAWTNFISILQRTWNRFSGFFRRVWARIRGVFGADAEAEIARINEEEARREQEINAQRDAVLQERERERKRRRNQIEQERAGVEDELNRMQEDERRQREAARQAELAETERELEEARQEWRDALAEARRRREESEAGRPERMRRAGELPDLETITEMAQKKADVQGTFSALAVRGLGATSLAERTAKATEQVAANTKKLLDKAKEGGLVFA